MDSPNLNNHKEQGNTLCDAEITKYNEYTWSVIEAAIRVHSLLGPGLLESTYERCLCYELKKRGIQFRSQVLLPILYDGVEIDRGFRIDLLVEEAVIIELKTVDKIAPIHKAQLLSYLRLSDKRIGLIINFNVIRLMDGIKRMVNKI